MSKTQSKGEFRERFIASRFSDGDKLQYPLSLSIALACGHFIAYRISSPSCTSCAPRNEESFSATVTPKLFCPCLTMVCQQTDELSCALDLYSECCLHCRAVTPTPSPCISLASAGNVILARVLFVAIVHAASSKNKNHLLLIAVDGFYANV